MKSNLKIISTFALFIMSSSTFALPIECQYLSKQGIITGNYIDDASEESEKVCLSDYIEVGNSKKNNISYYAYGNKFERIEKVVLTLGLTEKSDEASTLNEYGKYISILFKKYTGTNLSSEYLSQIIHRKPFSKRIGNYSLSMEKIGTNTQYGLVTEIKKIK
ncbi:hypothetical protein [Acinetobacter nectaris]|uniref:hypothetical protein n=1 Tax=Acinetobacter nectaris TaxID=1219382 RepID=UPI001F1E6FFA|nr:hypothetical protein [Acinetobacter nectaris]MCF9028562.1 hypothetical protein [Acinetobacter nectaris]